MKYLSACTVFIISFCLIGSGFAPSLPRQAKKYLISGKTMGTYYNVTVNTSKNIVKQNLKQKIEMQLKMTNKQMSLYLSSSEISIFNKANSNTPVKISTDFYKVMIMADELYNMTDGAWDGTIRPLYNLWNFDSYRISGLTIPDQKEIELNLAKTGFKNIIINEKTLIKKTPVTLDLGSIAKGYGVDAVSKLLKESGFNNFFVDIGGEVYAEGERSLSKKWRIGIAHPDPGFHSSPYKTIELSDMAVATSGTYRNFFEYNGKTFSHIINPKTGWPVDNNTVSLSVIADNCMLADGLATGLLVMGRQRAIELVNSLDNIECMIIIKNKKGMLENYFSKGFESYLGQK